MHLLIGYRRHLKTGVTQHHAWSDRSCRSSVPTFGHALPMRSDLLLCSPLRLNRYVIMADDAVASMVVGIGMVMNAPAFLLVPLPFVVHPVQAPLQSRDLPTPDRMNDRQLLLSSVPHDRSKHSNVVLLWLLQHRWVTMLFLPLGQRRCFGGTRVWKSRPIFSRTSRRFKYCTRIRGRRTSNSVAQCCLGYSHPGPHHSDPKLHRRCKPTGKQSASKVCWASD